MICNKVIQSLNTKNKFRVALQILEDLWKEEKITIKTKQVIIKRLEENIITFSVYLVDSVPATSILKRKGNERETIKKKLKYQQLS